MLLSNSARWQFVYNRRDWHGAEQVSLQEAVCVVRHAGSRNVDDGVRVDIAHVHALVLPVFLRVLDDA